MLNSMDKLQVRFPGVSPVHGTQDCIAATLSWHQQLVADVRTLSDQREDLQFFLVSNLNLNLDLFLIFFLFLHLSPGSR